MVILVGLEVVVNIVNGNNKLNNIIDFLIIKTQSLDLTNFFGWPQRPTFGLDAVIVYR